MGSDQVIEAFQAAVDADPSHRAKILAELGRRSPALAGECERLLAAHDRAQRQRFLEQHAAGRVLADLAEAPAPAVSKAREARPPEPPGFKLVKLLGRGGFGEVWIAENSTTGTIRAVKMIPDSVGQELAGLRRITSAVQGHPGLVQVDHVTPAGDWLIAAMPLADPAESSGPVQSISAYRPLTLRAYSARSVRLDARDAAAIGAAVADGLSHLHASGLAHGDVKPDNILRFDRQWRLGDYSLVHPADEPRQRSGTPDFVPPEGPGGVGADQFALAVTLFAAMENRDPTAFAAWRDSKAGQPDRDAARRALDVAVRRAGAASVNDRFASIDVFRDALRRAAKAGTAEGRTGRRRWNVYALGSIAVIAIAAGVLASRSWTSPPARHEPVEPLGRARIESLSASLRGVGDQRVRASTAADFFGSPPEMRVGSSDFTLTVGLSRPASVYVLFLRPDGGVELCWPSSPDGLGLAGDAPHTTDEVIYPTSPSLVYKLEEGEGLGLAGILVVASGRPFPAFRDWPGRNTLSDAWASRDPSSASSEVGSEWLVFDAEGMRPLVRTRSVGVARPSATDGVLGVVQAVRRVDGVDDVHAIFFPVLPAAP